MIDVASADSMISVPSDFVFVVTFMYAPRFFLELETYYAL